MGGKLSALSHQLSATSSRLRRVQTAPLVPVNAFAIYGWEGIDPSPSIRAVGAGFTPARMDA